MSFPNVDMSEAAVSRRLAEVVALNRVCDSLQHAGSAKWGGHPVWEVRLQVLRRQLRSMPAAASLPELVALWQAPDFTGPARYLEFTALLTDACRASTQVHAHFAAVRNASRPTAGQRQGVSDWLALNDALDEPDVSLAWFDEAVAIGAEVLPWSRLTRRVLERGRPGDYAMLFPDSLERMRTTRQLLDDESLPAERQAVVRRKWQLEAALLVRAGEASGAAPGLRTAATELDASPEFSTQLSRSFDELRLEWLARREEFSGA